VIVYVESNFFLEVALGQEQASPAEAVLTLAEKGKIELAFPGFALSEPFATLMQRDRDRRRLRGSFTEMLQQLQRSEPHKQIVSDLQPVPIILTNIVEKEIQLLQSTVSRLLNVSKCIETNAPDFTQALAYQGTLALSPQDSIIYSVVIADMQRRSIQEIKCFLSRDKEAFATNRRIKSELASYNCRYIGSFREGLNFIQRFA
jgi:predicted nucleic acid-binding protein